MPALDLSKLILKPGGHVKPEDGLCVMEAVAMFAGKNHTDAPPCVDRALRSYCMHGNDRFSDDDRQRFIPYIPRLVGTNQGDALALKRAKHLAWAAVTVFAAMAMEAAGLKEHADKLRAVPQYDWKTARASCQEAREAARKKWRAAAAYVAAYAYAAAAEAAAYAKKKSTEHRKALVDVYFKALDEALELKPEEDAI